MLIDIKTNVFKIPERLKEIDKNLSVKYNTDSDVFEVHGIDNLGDYILARFKELDCRVIDAVRKGYYLAQSGHPYRVLLHEQDRLDELAEKERLKRLEDIEYGVRDSLRFAGKVVVNGATF